MIIDTANTLRKAAALIDLRDAAQVVLDIEQPGEKVQEVLINSDSATSLKELLNPPASKPTKTVFKIAYRSNYNRHVYIGGTLAYPRKTEFNTVEEAMDEMDYLRTVKHAPSSQYFIVQQDVEA